ncbi:ATP-grasp domain-containing protein [Streptomyces platensis]|uniref:ATP-grasp domain-containing protein n=1 Tax=Streptomyces platensis TaxID=58346 RepID=UPI002E118399|nr:ATP-grasp domain-containing protein [Streptomyces platensis]
MTLVVIGANPTVARAAEALPGDLLHVQLPGAPALDRSNRTPGTQQVHTVDFHDGPAFLAFVDEVLKPLSPTAVVSLTELGLEPAAAAAERLGVRGVAPAVVRHTRDKLEMRRVLARKAPHLNPAFASGGDPDAVARLFAGHTPVVAKPVNGVGSNAVALLDRAADLTADRRTAGTLLEAFVGGLEFSVETLSAGGRHTVVGIAQKGTTGSFVEVSHMMPPPALDARGRARVEEAVGQLLDALGLADGPSHTEVKVDGDRVIVIETHNRLGGDGIADLVRLTTGIDWRVAALGWAVGAGVPRGQAAAATAATVFFTAPPGTVTAVAPPPSLAHGTIVEWEVTVEPGDPVRPLRSSTDRLGTAVVTAADAAACVAAVAELTALPIVTTQPDVPVRTLTDPRSTAQPDAASPDSAAPPSTVTQPAPVA